MKIEEPKGFPMIVKVYGIKLLNRAFHLDEVYVKLWGWTQWQEEKEVTGIDFNEHKSVLA